MTVSYKKSGPGGGSYYINCMTPDGVASVDDYYAGSAKEPPGIWYVGPDSNGNRLSDLGIEHGLVFESVTGRLDTERFSNLVAGYHPEHGHNLVQNAGSQDRIAIHDFCLSAPKSVSVVWSQAPDELKSKIEAAQSKSSQQFLDYMSIKSYTRAGKQGINKIHAPLRAALFGHGSSRENDPQLHTHAVAFNICERPDGKTGALETLGMMRWTGAAASLYHASLAWEMRELGFGIKKEGNLFEIAGVPEDVREAFSQRRAQILEAVKKDMEKLGLDGDAQEASRGLFQKATIETRDAKNELTREELQAIWLTRGKELGFSVAEVLALAKNDPAPVLTDEELLQEAVLAVDQITETSAIFKDPALLTKVAVRLTGRASVEQIHRAVALVKQHYLVVSEAEQQGLGSFRVEEADDVYTTREMLAVEQRMLELARRQDEQHVLSGIELDPDQKLDQEQLSAARAATTDVKAVTVIEGAAGAGKTFTMASIARAYESAGYTVTGLAGSWTAALNLKDAAKLAEGRAITGWLNGVRDGTISISNKSLIVIDEAGMVGARDMKGVLEAADRAGAKVVLLGDTLQQKSIAAGDALRVIAKQNGTNRIDIIRRQEDARDREAVHQFFAGQSHEGLAHYSQKDAIKYLRGNSATHTQIISDWHKSRLANSDQSHLILATDKKSVLEINRLAHQARKDAGELGESHLFRTMDSKKEGDLIEFSVNDEVAFRVNDIKQEVFNRVRGKIESFNGDIIRVRTEKGLLMNIDTTLDKWQHTDGGLGLQHAYCTTTYSSQSLTFDRVLVKDSTALDRASAGVAMSRHRKTCDVYIDTQARYEARMKVTPADAWTPYKDYSAKDCQDDVARTWSRDSVKDSTLDFNNWKSAAGASVDVVQESKILTLEDAGEKARSEIKRIQEIKTFDKTSFELFLRDGTSIKLGDTLPFQKADAYKLQEIEAKRESFERGVEPMMEDSIDSEAMKEAHEKGFLRFEEDGKPVYCGRRSEDDALVLLQRDDELMNEPPALRGRFAPVLPGDPDRVKVVRTGREALHLRSLELRELREELKPSTIIVSAGRDSSLAAGQARLAIEKAKNVERHDQKEVKKDREPDLVEANRRSAEQARLAEEQRQAQRAQ